MIWLHFKARVRTGVPLVFLSSFLGCAPQNTNIQRLNSDDLAPKKVYVAPQGSDDIGTGSITAPYATLKKAVRGLTPGSQVLLRGGFYPHTQVVLEVDGTSSAPIQLGSYPGEMAILQGNGIQKGILDEEEDKSKIASVLDVRNSKHVIIENLEVTDSPGYGVSTWDSESITIRSCKIHHTWSRGLGGSGKHLAFIDNEIYDVVLQNQNESVFDSKERGRQRYWSAAAATWYRPGGAPSEDVTWKRNKIHDSWGEGLIALQVDGARLLENEVFNTYSGLIYIDHSRNVTVDSNFVYHSDRKLIRRDEKEVSPGIYFASEGYRGIGPFVLENIQITRNVIVNTGVGIGFWRDPNNPSPENTYRNVLIANNLIFGASIISVNLPVVPTGDLSRSRNRLVNNIIFEPRYLWNDNPEPTILRVDNPELWEVDSNQFEKKLPANLSGKFLSFSNNQFSAIELTAPRVSIPMTRERFKPRCESSTWGKGLKLENINFEVTSIGPWKKCR